MSTQHDRREGPRFVVQVATEADRVQIARLRHAIYAQELHQHSENSTCQLHDSLDNHNVYIVVREADAVVGFVSITPPGAPAFSVDKYFDRIDLPCVLDASTFEVRLLTVQRQSRGLAIFGMLIYAAYRWVTAHGGTRIVAIGRSDLVSLYERIGLQRSGRSTRSGALYYEFMWANEDRFSPKLEKYAKVIERFEGRFDWNLMMPFSRPAACFHGGMFFKAVGERFDRLERSAQIINADVLDAWFDPAPSVLSSVQQYLPWLLKTSPPTYCDGLIDTLAEVRGVPRGSLLPGAGSSDLIFRGLSTILNRTSRVLVLDPTYGEYGHVLERLIACHVDRIELQRASNYDVLLDELTHRAKRGYDLIIIVNPNSPTGRCISKPEFAWFLRQVPAATQVWIDETYIEYVGTGESLESLAAVSDHVFVCKSMSKVYALSGARVAYLCAAPQTLETLRSRTPPWVVALPSQVAAVAALQAPEYYQQRYRETHIERTRLAAKLDQFGWQVVPGVANFLLCHLPESGPSASRVVEYCRQQNVFLRDAGGMGTALGDRAIRIAVRSPAENDRVIELLTSIFVPTRFEAAG